MSNIRQVITGIGIAVVLSGCLGAGVIEDITIEATPKLVVVGFLCPQDSILRISVRQTYPVNEFANTDLSIVKDASVRLSNRDKEVLFVYQPAQRWYEISARQFPIEAGQIYQLDVRKDGFAPISVTCVVPPLAPKPALTYEGNDRFVVDWLDDANQRNFYRVFCRAEPNPSTSTYQIQSTWTRGLKESLVTDDGVNGTHMSSSEGRFLLLGLGSGSGPIAGPSQRPSVDNLSQLDATLDLINTDEAYYQYHRYVLGNTNQDNPFTEPAPPYTNIPGGLGVFAGYNRTTVRVKVK